MKRIYITAVPLPSNFLLSAQKVECVNIELCEDGRFTFPISRLIAATAQDGDEAEVIAVRQTNDSGDGNLDLLKRDLASLTVSCRLTDITMPETQERGDLLNLFRALARTIPPRCCVYADATFGTKTYPIVLLSALNYAEKIKECELHRLIYQEQRRDAQTHRPTGTYLYDITVLFRLNGVVDALSQSEADVGEKDGLLSSLMDL